MISSRLVFRVVRILLVAVAGFGALVTPGIARAAGLDSVTEVSQPGDYVGDGADYLYDSATGSVALSGTLSAAQLTVTDNPGSPISGDLSTLVFAAPDGDQLADGTYGEGPDITTDGASCEADDGSFTVRDIGTDAEGNVDRLWLTYMEQCPADPIVANGPTAPWLFGEVRVGEPPATTPETTEPEIVDWPETPAFATGTAVPITVVGGTDGADLTGLSLGGADPSDFQLSDGSCAGAVLDPGGRCQASVTFAPSDEWPLSAELIIDDNSGASTTVALSGNATAPPAVVPTTLSLGDTEGNTYIEGNAPFYGEPIEFQADVEAATGSPTGTIQYSVNGQAAGPPTPLGPGAQVDDGLQVPIGGTVSAAYSGSEYFAPSSASITPDIQPASTTLTLASSPNPATDGQPVTITATVKDPLTKLTPVGDVLFNILGETFSEPLDGNGQATLVVAPPVGSDVILATYNDDVAPSGEFAWSYNTLEQTVTATSATTSTTSSSAASTSSAVATSSSTSTATQTSSSGSVGATSTAVPPKQRPAYVVGSPLVQSGGHIEITVESLRGGTFTAVATGTGEAHRTIGSGKITLAAGRRGGLVVTLRASARQAMTRGATMLVRVVVTYRPRGGQATKVLTTVVKLARSRRVS